MELGRGQFRVKGDTVDLYLAYEEIIIRIIFWGDEIESISSLNPETMETELQLEGYKIFPANIFVSTKERTASAIHQIELDWVNKSTCSATKAVRSRPNGFTNV